MRRLALPACLGTAAVLAAAALAAYSGDESQLARFTKANRLYEAGQVQLAIQEYERIAAAGYESGRVHYNLGTAYARLGRLGPAVLNLERAVRLMPRDPEVADNLRFVRARLADAAPEDDAGLPARLWRATAGALTGRELALAGLAAYWLAALLAGLWLYYRHGPRGRALGWGALAAAVLLAACLTPLGLRRLADRHPAAVVMAPETAVRSGPAESNTALFKLHEGTTVRILQSEAGWSRVGLPNGLTGWLPEGEVSRI